VLGFSLLRQIKGAAEKIQYPLLSLKSRWHDFLNDSKDPPVYMRICKTPDVAACQSRRLIDGVRNISWVSPNVFAPHFRAFKTWSIQSWVWGGEGLGERTPQWDAI